MSDNPKSTFARRVRAARPRDRKYELRDDMVTGLGLAVQPTGVRTFVFNRMVREHRRYATVGSADAMTVPEARTEARKLIAAFLDTVKNDNGPRTPGHPMDAFAAEFLDRQVRRWKPGTRETNGYLVRKYILPAFGHMTVDAIAVEHVKDWFASMADRPGAANRAFEILRAMMFRAEEWGLRERGSNPCLGIAKNPRKKLARFLDADELGRLGRALDARETQWPEAVAAIRPLALTGCRRSEVLDLRWRDIGGDAISLRDSKTGPVRAIPMRSCFRTMPKAEAPIALRRAGERYATTRSSAACVCTTFGTPPQAKRSCRARICPWSASCSGTGGTAPPPATHTSPTGISSKRGKRLVR